MTTDFSKVCDILGMFYFRFRDTDDLSQFLEFNDVGLPLSYLVSEGLCEISEDGKKYVAETWELFLTSLGIEDTGYTELQEVLDKADKEGTDNPDSLF